MDTAEFNDDEYEEEDENYNNGILIDTENLPVMRLLTPFNTEASGIYGRLVEIGILTCSTFEN